MEKAIEYKFQPSNIVGLKWEEFDGDNCRTISVSLLWTTNGSG